MEDRNKYITNNVSKDKEKNSLRKKQIFIKRGFKNLDN